MGLDIHTCIECRHPEGGSGWRTWAMPFCLNRDRALFIRLGGPGGEDGAPPLIPPRGFPVDASPETVGEFFAEVGNWEEVELVCHQATRREADAWVAAGESYYRDESRRLVSGHGCLCPTWLTGDELELVIHPSDPDIHLLLTALRALESAGMQARIVMWFCY
ncbi:MAG: hypothetical protein EOP86_27165 [Verrucomicrobiaceae bacterium]|nr:MAG: hypothetical protein EOP86_27165 [Verrucomicrobiaceae bacterium]